GVGCTSQGNPDALTDNAAAGYAVMRILQFAAKIGQIILKTLRKVVLDVAFVRKIEAGFNFGAQIEKRIPPAVDLFCQPAVIACKGLLALFFRFGAEEVTQPLNGHQIEFPVLEGPAGEFSGLSQTKALPAQFTQDGLNAGWRTMHVKLGAVLAGKT